MTIAQQLKIKEFPLRIKDLKGKTIYFENSNGYWEKREYDANGNLIYSEDSNGYWCKSEYDANGKLIRSEFSNGYCEHLREYDANGNLIYSEDSNGTIVDNRPKVTLTLDEVGFVGTQKEQSAASKKYHAQKTSEFFKFARKVKQIAVDKLQIKK